MNKMKQNKSHPISFLFIISLTLWCFSCAADVSPYGRSISNQAKAPDIIKPQIKESSVKRPSLENERVTSSLEVNRVMPSSLEKLKIQSMAAVKEGQDSLLPGYLYQLHSAIKVDSLDAELWYIAGYVYDRSIAHPGNEARRYDLEDLIKVSKYFEKVIEIESNYGGRLILLPPRQKILSTWGSMAIAYQSELKLDSVKWSFEQAKVRGALTPYMEDFGKHYLTQLPRGAIVFDNGDLMTFLFMYLQAVHQVRSDVNLINLSMLARNFSWEYYQNQVHHDKNFPVSLDSNLVLWEEEVYPLKVGPVHLVDLNTEFESQILYQYQNRALSIISKNEGGRPICWNPFMAQSAYLALSEYLESYSWYKCLSAEDSDTTRIDWSIQLENFNPLILSDQIMMEQQGGEYLRASYHNLKDDPLLAQQLLNIFKLNFYPKYDDQARSKVDPYVQRYQDDINAKLKANPVDAGIDKDSLSR